jgi:uncharacterized membrane protein
MVPGDFYMGKNRLEAFSDGVLAIIITVMLLEIKVPHGEDLGALRGLTPVFLSYVLSFIYVGIYWNNHHHMLYAVKEISGPALWANSYLLFWLSLLPFVTGWMGENHFATWPVALYGFVLLMSAGAYTILARVLVYHGHNAVLAQALGRDAKGYLSLALYLAGIGTSFLNPWIGVVFYAAVAMLWVVPDRRIEKHTIHHDAA